MSFISEAQYLPEELTIEWGELGCNIQSSLLKILHFQKLAYSLRTMFAIVEKIFF